MRLNSLKVAGFKSFADSTTLNFKDSRTAIVGPNGCGKSNVIDAIRWVMGESSAKQLRGGNMQDVIFAGTSQRKPVGVASVELRFENTYGKLGGAYNAYTELSVKRQVNREGKSEYFLNGTRCRRKDVTDIFLGTGLGPRSYAVIEQGMINRLVDAKPEEMRIFIEEAAGISRYQARRKETLQHLQHTQDNLARLNDIALELESQIKSLKRQAEQAEKYQQLKQEIRTHKVQLLSWQYHQVLQQVEQLTKRLAEQNEYYQTQHKALEQVEIEWHLLQQELQKQLPQAETLQQAWQKVQQAHQQVLWQLQQDISQQQNLHNSIADLEQQHARLQDEQSRIDEELQQLCTQIQSSEKALQDSQQTQQDSAIDVDALRARFEQQQQDFQREQQHLQQLQQQQNQLQYQLEQVEKTIQRAQQRLEQLHGQQQQYQVDDLVLQLEELNLEFANVQLKLEQAKTQEQQQNQQLEQQLQQQDELQQQVKELHLLQKNLQREQSQTGHLLKQLQQEQQQAQHPLLASLQLSPEGQQYSQYIEKILAQWLNAETVSEIDWSYSGARQLQPEMVQGEKSNLALQPITVWIAQPQHSLWQNILIADTLEQAKALTSKLQAVQSIVSKDGYWLGVDWWINLNVDVQQQGNGQLHYHTHLQQLGQQLQQVASQIPPLEQQLQTVQHTVAENRQVIDASRQQLKQQEQQEQQLNTEKAKLQVVLDNQQQNDLQLQQQIHQLQQQIEDDRQEQEQIQYDVVSLKLKIEQIQPQVVAQQEQYLQNKERLSNLQQQAQQDQQQLYQLQSTLQQQQAKHALLQQDQQYRQDRIEQVAEQRLNNQQQLTRLIIRIEEQQVQEQAAKEKADTEQQHWLAWQAKVEQLQQQQQGLNEQRLQQQQQVATQRDELEQTRLTWQQHKAEQQYILEQLQQLGESQAQEVQINIDVVKRALEKAEQQFSRIGAINLAAFEELQQLQVRYDELTHQTQDLQNTIEQLQEAMKSIDQETKQLFMKTFNQVNHELQDLFPKVFTGGEASLSLEDDWQSGVRLMARPPGKRNSTLALLSGGEKALTALALVFAIFRLNPAPFCVLDEVDAPLDDANVNRFCNLVKELSQQVQFIYITHNKVAMTMATDLLGITMPEAGSSKLVAVSLAQAEAYVE